MCTSEISFSVEDECAYDEYDSSSSYYESLDLSEPYIEKPSMPLKDLPSSMTQAQLEVLHYDYGIPPIVHLRVPRLDEIIDNPPEGDVALYLAMSHFGVRLPLPLFLQSFLTFIQLGPTKFYRTNGVIS
ncbi:unnamed protein product [Citrullus colocynthis]|uniref:Uncharacterized protein n=1 Tax=Citrullus colocynthis TaxID=252529 RepID=A0ABP0Y098_9ROSI